MKKTRNPVRSFVRAGLTKLLLANIMKLNRGERGVFAMASYEANCATVPPVLFWVMGEDSWKIVAFF